MMEVPTQTPLKHYDHKGHIATTDGDMQEETHREPLQHVPQTLPEKHGRQHGRAPQTRYQARRDPC